MLKVITIIGTRPEIIRLSQVISLLDKYLDHKLVHTGQNYDYELSEIFFRDLSIRKPDYFLSVDTTTLGSSIAEIISKTERILLQEKPDAVLILGDTNSALSSLIAKRMKIPIYHMEAGNRSFDSNVPEETNRKVVDHIADFNLVYTEHARRNLINEGIHDRFIYLTGSPMREVLENILPKIKKSTILKELRLKQNNYFLVSLHREENVDNPDSLKFINSTLNSLYQKYKIPVVISTHPRTRKRIQALGIEEENNLIMYMKPFGFIDYNSLQLNSFCTISDSGTISEESAILGFPAVTFRKSIERPEALDTGSISLTGLGIDNFFEAINIATTNREHLSKSPKEIPESYKIRNVSERVLKLIIGTAKLTSKWKNMDQFSRYDWDD